MRTLKLLVLSLLGIALVVIGVANMAPVDLYLVPAEIDGGRNALRGVPLAGVILASVVIGIVVGQLIEYAREAKHRREATQQRREAGQLRREVGRLAARLGDGDDDLPKIAAK